MHNLLKTIKKVTKLEFFTWRIKKNCCAETCNTDRQTGKSTRQKKISHYVVYHHFRKWSQDGSLVKVWHNNLVENQHLLDLSQLNLDGTHSLAKKRLKPAFAPHWCSSIRPRLDGSHCRQPQRCFWLGRQFRSDVFLYQATRFTNHWAHFDADSAFATPACCRICFKPSSESTYCRE